MKKFLIVILFFSFCLSGCNNDEAPVNNQSENNYTTSRTSTTNNLSDNNVSNTNIETSNTVVNDITSTTPAETELSSFSTKIYTPNDEARQNNIRITCSKLNETVVKAR